MKKETELEAYKQHLIAAGRSKATIERYLTTVRGFLKHVGNVPVDRITEDATRSYFANRKGHARQQRASIVSAFLNFSVSRLPVPVNARGAGSPRAAAPTKKELAIRQKWNVDKLLDQKTTDDDLIAKLARKVIDHYLYFQGRMKGDPENLDDLARFADECRELIENNLALFMRLSAQGRNIHSAIDERVQR